MSYSDGSLANNLRGDSSSTQSGMIVPKPQSSTIFYHGEQFPNQFCFEKKQDLGSDPENLAEGGGGCPQTKKNKLRKTALKKPRYPMVGTAEISSL